MLVFLYEPNGPNHPTHVCSETENKWDRASILCGINTRISLRISLIHHINTTHSINSRHVIKLTQANVMFTWPVYTQWNRLLTRINKKPRFCDAHAHQVPYSDILCQDTVAWSVLVRTLPRDRSNNAKTPYYCICAQLDTATRAFTMIARYHPIHIQMYITHTLYTYITLYTHT